MGIEIIYCRYSEDNDWKISIDENRAASYSVKWDVLVDSPTPCTGLGVLQTVQALEDNVEDPVPDEGDGPHYAHLGDEDFGSFLTTISCHQKFVDAKPVENTFVIQANYAPPKNNSKSEKQKIQKPNPLDWDPIYYVEWVEEDRVIEEAFCITSLPQLLRGTTLPSSLENPDSGEPEMGPLVNAAGQQTIDPVTEPVWHALLCCKINYPHAFQSMLLNNLYGAATNFAGEDEEDPILFLGCRPRTWRYLFAQAAEPLEKEVKGVGTVVYYPTIVKIEFNSMTWDRFILNNGQTCFRRTNFVSGSNYILDPRYDDGQPMLFPTTAQVLKDSSKWLEGVNGIPQEDQPSFSDMEEIESSEPMNLELDGTQIRDPKKPAFHIQYRHKREVDFNLIPPFMPLVAEYEAVFGP